jgi:hypothetical protein
MKSPRAALAAGAATFVLLAGVVGLGARGGAFGFGGDTRAEDLGPAVAAPVQSSDIVPAAGPATDTSIVAAPRSGLQDREQDGRKSHDGGHDDHDDDDD